MKKVYNIAQISNSESYYSFYRRTLVLGNNFSRSSVFWFTPSLIEFMFWVPYESL